MIIRKERLSDYMAISEVHCSAFENSKGQEESVLVALLRQEKGYHPELSLVAEKKGEIIGHVMVTRYTFQIHHTLIEGGILAPLGIRKEWQGKGIGTELMDKVHQAATELGLSFILLLGHDSYYPKFGYQTHMFGKASLEIDVSLLNGKNYELETRKPTQADIRELQSLWSATNEGVSLCMKQADHIQAWLSANKEMNNLVYLKNDQIIGYVRIHKQTQNMTYFLAESSKDAKDILLDVTKRCGLNGKVSLPLHPIRKDWFGPEILGETNDVWPAGMICTLNQNKEVTSYQKEVTIDPSKAGIILWPTPFEAI